MQPPHKSTEGLSQTLPPPQRGTWGLVRGSAHLKYERASMAMVRTGETSLSVGSALMITCPDSRAVSRQATQSPGMGKRGAWANSDHDGSRTPRVRARRT